MASRTLPNISNLEEECTTNIDDITVSEISELLNNRPEFTYILNEQNDINLDENINTDPSEIPSCSNCADNKRFDSGHDVKKGTHILFGKYFPVDIINKAINNMVEPICDCFSLDQKFFYFHHAIVADVKETSEYTAKVKLIEFTSVGSVTFKVVETEKELDVRDENIFYKNYAFPRYNAEDIVKRANSLLGIKSYELFSNNCENVAVWCTSGENESFQSSSFVDSKVRQIFSWIGSIVGKITQYAVSDMALPLSRFAKFAMLAIPCLAIAGVFFLIEAIVSALRFVELRNQKQRGFICTACYNKKKILLISKIALSLFATIALAAIPAAGKTTLTILSIVIGIAAIYILPQLCSFLYRKVKCIINPLYEVPRMVARKAEHITPGCVLTITGDHAILIKNVKLVGASTKFVGLDIVHFQYRGIWGTRTVISERFNFELKQDLLQVFDVPAHEAYPDDEVVKKALDKAKRREQGFHALWNRSSHVSKECKVRDKSKAFTSKRDVQVGFDVKAGDMVNFKYLGLPHVGIVVEKSFDDVVELEYYNVSNGIVKLETKEFDLGSGKIEKLIYPVRDIETVIDNAERQIGESVYSFRPYKSSRFVQSCTMPEK